MHIIHQDLDLNIIRKGEFKDNLLYNGQVKGFNKKWKNILIEYQNGIGHGTYEDKIHGYIYSGYFT